MELGLAKLKQLLAVKQARVRMRYNYYTMKNVREHLSSMIPASFQSMVTCLGWCAKSVDSLADRIVLDTFEQDDFGIGEIYRLNNADVLFDSAILSALIASCSFLYIGRNENGYPSVQVVDGYHATGTIDPTTNLLTEGYAILERDEWERPVLEAYFQPHRTVYYREGRHSQTFTHKAPYAALVPVIHRPDASRPFGHSRISRSCMALTQSALRTLVRSEVSAEFYSFPQKYVLGLSEDTEFSTRAGTMSSFLDLRKDSDGDKPQVGQFQQQSMAPYMDQMRSIASLFAGETDLTLDDLGFSTENPSSSEAIKASHENLRLKARKAQRTFGTGFVNAGYIAACIRDDQSYDRRAFANTAVSWLPIFEPDASALGVIGDAVLKINQASEGFLGDRNIRKLTGLESDQV